MTIQRIDADEATARATRLLGLDDGAVDLFSQEGLCASLRRAASFLCPAAPKEIVDAVLGALMPLASGPALSRDDVTRSLEALINSGDLLELQEPNSRARQLFLGPPSYVEIHSGKYRLLGIRPYAEPLVDEDALGAEVMYEGHTRTVTLDPTTGSELLRGANLHHLTREQWAKVPRQERADVVIQHAVEHLGGQGPSGNISGLTLIDSAASVRYYKGRWREPSPSDNGIFVGRRPQTYGAAIWCVLELASGVPQAVADLPLESNTTPGWDEGRRLQAALDAQRGAPQIFRVRGLSDGAPVVDFFAPLPSWAERYLELAGLPIARTQGSLFSYRLTRHAVGDAMDFLSESLWMMSTEGE